MRTASTKTRFGSFYRIQKMTGKISNHNAETINVGDPIVSSNPLSPYWMAYADSYMPTVKATNDVAVPT